MNKIIPDFNDIEINTNRVIEMIQVLSDFFYKYWEELDDDILYPIDFMKYKYGFYKIRLSNKKITICVLNTCFSFYYLKLSKDGINVSLNNSLFNNYRVTIPYNFARLLTYFDDNGIFEDAVSYFETQILLSKEEY